VDLVFEVVLGSSARGARVALLRELSGLDELVSERAGPVAATELLERLLVEAPGPALRKADLWSLPLGERDRLVAGLHARHFGDRIESIVACSGCGKVFAVDFSLGALLASLSDEADGEDAVGPDESGAYSLSGGRRFRLPCCDDERAIRALTPSQAAAELLGRCVIEGDGEEDTWVHAAMAKVGPVLDLELPTRCALCGTEQSVHFDIVSFFFATLARERSLLLREVHRIAVAYHWGYEEILRLSRTARRAFVTLVEAERGRIRTAS
jgi:hypothetical protein